MADDVKLWRCPNCGQTHFGDNPPDMCDFCKDFTTWQPIEPQIKPRLDYPPKENPKN